MGLSGTLVKIFGLGATIGAGSGQSPQKFSSNLGRAINVRYNICKPMNGSNLCTYICPFLLPYSILVYLYAGVYVEEKIFKRYLEAGGRHQDKRTSSKVEITKLRLLSYTDSFMFPSRPSKAIAS